MDVREQTGTVTLADRRRLTLTGATEVVRFDEEIVELNTSLGAVTIEGADLRLKCLSLDTGTVVVEGTIRGFQYEEVHQRRRWGR